MKISPDWNKAALLDSPLFAPLHPILAGFEPTGLPTLHDCNTLLSLSEPPIFVQSGKTLRFVPQECGKLAFEAQYEPRCYLAGEVQMRANNWHDLLNALVWLTAPKSKAVLNARHYLALLEERAQGNSVRGKVRDVNTLLDESGVIVAYSDAGLAELLQGFKWKELFWQRRDRVRASMGFYLFGHGLYEKALHPYPGMTGQGLLLAVEQEFFDWPLAQQLKHLDSHLAQHLAETVHDSNNRDFAPVPLLGVPGWSVQNEDAEYYDNTAYFRPGRRT